MSLTFNHFKLFCLARCNEVINTFDCDTGYDISFKIDDYCIVDKDKKYNNIFITSVSPFMAVYYTLEFTGLFDKVKKEVMSKYDKNFKPNNEHVFYCIVEHMFTNDNIHLEKYNHKTICLNS